MKLPLPVIVLDLIASLILGLGLVAHFAEVHILPESLRVENYAVIMMAVGGALFILAMVLMLKAIMANQNK